MKHISTQIVMSFLLVIILTVGIIGLTVSSKVQKELTIQTEALLQQTANATQNQLDLTLQKIEETIALIPKLPEISQSVGKIETGLTEASVKDTNALLKSFNEGIQSISEVIFIADTKGNILLDSVDGSYNTLNISERAYFADAINGNAVWSEVVTSKGTGNLVSVYVLPIKNSEGKVVALLAAAIKFNAITEPLEAIKVGKTGYAFMIDQKGLILSHPIVEKINKENLFDAKSESLTKQLDEMVALKSGKGYYVYNGEEKLNVYQPIKNWSFAINIVKKDYLSAVRETNYFIIFLSFGVLIIAIAIAFWIAREISKPITEVTQLIRKAETGNLDVEAKINRKDELGVLGQALNQWISGLRNNRNAILALSEGDMSQVVTPRSDQDELAFAVIKLKAILNQLVSELDKIGGATSVGDLKVRADVKNTQGVWQEVLLSVNGIADAYQKPIEDTSAILNQIAAGKIPGLIEEKYYGEFNVIKDSLNKTIGAIKALIVETDGLIQNAVSGKLEARANVGDLHGDYKGIINGMNSILDAILLPIQEALVVLEDLSHGNLKNKVKGEYKGDHARIQTALNTTVEILSLYVGDIDQILGTVRNGDLTKQIKRDYLGDFKPIKTSINSIVTDLNQVFSNIDDAADQVNLGARALANAAESLSQGATEQASAVEEISASMTHIAEKAKSNARQAGVVATASSGIKEKAETGNSSMQSLLKSMQDIDTASTKISSIIKVIDEIAFQTNILALNAAVEAARAGEHGKGFAVVAEEVRNLASRSSNAAKDTTALIEHTGQVVKEGKRIAGETASQLTEIVSGIQHTTEDISHISAASLEQADAVSQISAGIDQVAQVTHMNSASSEETAATAEQMSSQAEVLKGLVEGFKLRA
jgi:methyl-accepting chemotaxis protein